MNDHLETLLSRQELQTRYITGIALRHFTTSAKKVGNTGEFGIDLQTLLYLKWITGTSLAAQWVRPRASIAGGTGTSPGLGTKIPRATQHGKNKTDKHYCITQGTLLNIM